MFLPLLLQLTVYLYMFITIAIGTDYLGDANGEMDDDELTRDKVKRASTQILQQIDKRKRKAPKKKDEKGHARKEEKSAD